MEWIYNLFIYSYFEAYFKSVIFWEKMASKPILGYWNQRGLGQQARLLLTYLGVDFVDKRYSRGEDGKGSEWFEKERSHLDLTFLTYVGFF